VAAAIVAVLQMRGVVVMKSIVAALLTPVAVKASVVVLRPGPGVTRKADVARPMLDVATVNDVQTVNDAKKANVVARRRAAVAVDLDPTARVAARRCLDLVLDRWPAREADVLLAVLRKGMMLRRNVTRTSTREVKTGLATERDANVVAHPT